MHTRNKDMSDILENVYRNELIHKIKISIKKYLLYLFCLVCLQSRFQLFTWKLKLQICIIKLNLQTIAEQALK